MLPDLPKLKADLARLQDRYIQQQIRRRLGAFEGSPTSILHEGKRTRLVRAGGDVEESGLKQESALVTVSDSELAMLNAETRRQKLDDLAAEMASKISKNFFAVLDETLKRAGQTVDGKGKGLTAETILMAFETMQTDFDEDGSPAELSFICSPDMQPSFQRAMEEMQRDPALRKRYDALILRKKEAWRDREAARKLVG